MDKRTITIGRVTLTIEAEYDDSADYSDLGGYASNREARLWDDKVAWYSIEDDAIRLPKSDIWQDRRGRIVAEPENLDWHNNSFHRETEFYKLNAENYLGEKSRLTYLFQDADRLRGLDHADWCYMGVVATVSMLNREIAHASVWGIESDSDESYFQECARDMAREAMKGAKAFKQSIVA